MQAKQQSCLKLVTRVKTPLFFLDRVATPGFSTPNLLNSVYALHLPNVWHDNPFNYSVHCKAQSLHHWISHSAHSNTFWSVLWMSQEQQPACTWKTSPKPQAGSFLILNPEPWIQDRSDGLRKRWWLEHVMELMLKGNEWELRCKHFFLHGIASSEKEY